MIHKVSLTVLNAGQLAFLNMHLKSDFFFLHLGKSFPWHLLYKSTYMSEALRNRPECFLTRQRILKGVDAGPDKTTK